VKRPTFAASCLIALVLAACSAAPAPSHVTGAYRGKLSDDVLFEASTTVLVTKRDVVVALDCGVLGNATGRGDAATIDRAVAAGVAVRLPARVTLYTPPFSEANPAAEPTVVTDDKYAGRLCTPDAYDVVKS
jgi:hypothetical protein